MFNFKINVYAIQETEQPESVQKNPYDIPDDSDIRIDFTPLYDIKISEKFPFSLPWDIKRTIEVFKSKESKGEAPIWKLPIKNEVIVIDFNIFNEIAGIARTFNLLIYVVSLIIVTSRFVSGP